MKPQTDIGKSISVVDLGKQTSLPRNLYPLQQRLLKWTEAIGLRNEELLAPVNDDFLQRIDASVQARKAQNLHLILQKTMQAPTPKAPNGQLDPEWWFSFIEMAQLVHSAAMQELWSKILVLELLSPGSVSVNTLKIIGQISAKDAKLFNLVLNMSMRNANDSVPMIVSGYQRQPRLFQFSRKSLSGNINVGRFGLNYPAILSLTQLGLLFKDEIMSDEMTLGKRQQWSFGETLFYVAPKENGLRLRYYKMTNSGAELAKVLQRAEQSQYFIEMKKVLKKQFELY